MVINSTLSAVRSVIKKKSAEIIIKAELKASQTIARFISFFRLIKHLFFIFCKQHISVQERYIS